MAADKHRIEPLLADGKFVTGRLWPSACVRNDARLLRHLLPCAIHAELFWPQFRALVRLIKPLRLGRRLLPTCRSRVEHTTNIPCLLDIFCYRQSWQREVLVAIRRAVAKAAAKASFFVQAARNTSVGKAANVFLAKVVIRPPLHERPSFKYVQDSFYRLQLWIPGLIPSAVQVRSVHSQQLVQRPVDVSEGPPVVEPEP
mmetsp:Transcript_56863/g.113114  ORF Transcript_56863/g.113114 Transcript_56863/m.113114 type:complete len:200 (-) Transcript_56863:762-1361(-)